jgi:hypothetical protein
MTPSPNHTGPMRAFYAIFSLLLSCVGGAAVEPQRLLLPSEIPINKEAGRGGHLIVNLRLETGEVLPCIVDTGSSATLLDRSVEPKLGQRISPVVVWMQMGQQEGGIYSAPRLYLGGVPIRTHHQILTYDFKRVPAFSRAGVLGILGMDCLQHYCLQLDFEAGTMRFLTPDAIRSGGLGREFQLEFSVTAAKKGVPSMGLLFMQHSGFLGANTRVLIDSGDNTDGGVDERTLRGHYLTRIAHFFIPWRSLRLGECAWSGETYRKLRVWPGEDCFGLKFLARHLVTFDFPNRKMYLKQTSTGPLSSIPRTRSLTKSADECSGSSSYAIDC